MKKKSNILAALRKENRFDFIVDENWWDDLEKISNYEKIGRLLCAEGILYLHARARTRKITKAYKERVKQRKQKELEMNIQETPEIEEVTTMLS